MMQLVYLKSPVEGKANSSPTCLAGSAIVYTKCNFSKTRWQSAADGLVISYDGWVWGTDFPRLLLRSERHWWWRCWRLLRSSRS